MAEIQPDPTAPLSGPETDIESSIARFLAAKQKAAGGGAYAEQCQYILEQFATWGETRRVRTMSDVDPDTLGRYAGRLSRRVRAREGDADAEAGISASTANAYWDILAGWCNWAVTHDLLDTNPARKARATENLPDDPGSSTSDQQFWSPQTREDIVRWCDWRAETALDHGWMDPKEAVRDRAFVATLAYSGARIGELLRSRSDDRRRRQGLRWTDVDLDDGTMTVLGKTQELEAAPIPDRAHRHLWSHYHRQDPPSEDWPVFPTGHLPSLYEALEEAVSDDVSDDDLGAMKTPDAIEDALRAHGATPPAMSTAGGRSLLKDLSRESGVREDGELLEPHGARRGIGDELYEKLGHEAAQQMLRHADPATTSAQYQHREASEMKKAADEVLGQTETE